MKLGTSEGNMEKKIVATFKNTQIYSGWLVPGLVFI